MSQPSLSGPALIEQVAATHPGDDRLALWWLGQSGYLLRWHDLTIVVDPFLSPRHAEISPDGDEGERLMAPPFAPADLTFCDLVMVTHQHADHFDPEAVPALLAASPDALLLVPAPLADYAADELRIADERLVPIRDGELFELRGLRVQAVAAAHDQLAVDEEGNTAHLSFVLQREPFSLLFGGDTVAYAGQEERLRPFAPQVACLPISGRSAARQSRGLKGNLTIAEAARLAAGIGAEVVIPNHYGMFAADTTEVAAFASHVAASYPKLRAVVLEPAARWYYPEPS
ncbi:MAG: MBL fold metallo-hydrolase [Armatimonadetes bacterium]|nr:MBL fold metallo-hydrolase [Armatimonadota bacterium]